MSEARNLTLNRWVPLLAPNAGRLPTGRVARVMTYYLANARGRNNARHWLDYVAAIEPESLDRIRIGLALAPAGRQEEFSSRELAVLRRKVRSAIAAARKAWNLPILSLNEDVYYVDLPEDHPAEDRTDVELYSSRNERAAALWGTTPRVIRPRAAEAREPGQAL